MINRRQKKQRYPQQQQKTPQDPPPSSSSEPPPELAAFSLAAAIQEARTSVVPPQQPQQQQRRVVLPFFSRQQNNHPSQASLATNTSFATANDTTTTTAFRASSEQNITPSAVSYFVDSSSDEETQDESLTFGNDPLSVLSRNTIIDVNKPTEISFFDNPEETTTNTTTSFIMSTVVDPTTIVPETTPATTEEEVVETTATDEPHFDVAQNIYGQTKSIWAWGKTIPVLSNVLTLTEGTAAKVLDLTIHMDLPSIDQDVVSPHAKKLDDVVITPVICKVWGIICPAVVKGEEMIVKPVLMEVVPRILGPLGFLKEEKKVEVVVEEKKNEIDKSVNPEVVPVALNWEWEKDRVLGIFVLYRLVHSLWMI